MQLITHISGTWGRPVGPYLIKHADELEPGQRLRVDGRELVIVARVAATPAYETPDGPALARAYTAIELSADALDLSEKLTTGEPERVANGHAVAAAGAALSFEAVRNRKAVPTLAR